MRIHLEILLASTITGSPVRGRGGESKRERLIHNFTKDLEELEAFEITRNTHVEQKMDEAVAGLSGSFNQMHKILEHFFTDNEKMRENMMHQITSMSDQVLNLQTHVIDAFLNQTQLAHWMWKMVQDGEYREIMFSGS